MSIEEWRPVPGHPGYEVSSRGRVRSLDRVMEVGSRWGKTVLLPLKGRMLRQATRPSGHRTLGLTGGQTRDVHALVLEAFVGPRPDGMEACHNNGDPADNRLENLRWDTRRENALDRIRHGTHEPSNRTHCPYGHPLQEPNLVKSPKGHQGRRCRACHRARAWVKYHPEDDYQQASDRYFAELLMTGGPPLPRRRPTQCQRGHKYTPENTYVRPDGRRLCRDCSVARAQERAA